MKGIHPNLGIMFLAAMSCAVLGAGGCSSNKTGISNPFLAPDRVPPPSTRVIAPGTALPYYQGDPLPVMQSAAPGTTSAPTAAVAAAPAAAATSAATPPVEPKKVAFSNEPTVSVPSDESDLRFELPKPPEPEPASAAPVANVQAAPQSAPTSSGVVPAVYNGAPTAGQPMNNVAPTAALAEPVSGSPWRSPQVATPARPPIAAPVPQQYAAPPGYVFVPPTAAAPQSTTGVSLRAVPSPLEPVESPAPRIRIPGYPPPVSTIPVTMSPVTSAPPAVSSDGFRPRSSMR